MTPVPQDQQESVDLFSLVDASMRELLQAIENESGGDNDAHVEQIADLVLAETVRLIRLGTRSETTDAGSELMSALISPSIEDLEDNHAEAFSSLIGAARVLRAASAPSSPGADLTVLRSWNEKALEVVQALNEAPGEELPRAEIRVLLGEVSESYLSHLLADLEAARLIFRVREGKVVTVHLGPVGRSERVRRMLPPKKTIPSWSQGQEQVIFFQSAPFEKELTFTPLRSAIDPSRLQDTGGYWHTRENELESKWVVADSPKHYRTVELPTVHTARLASADKQ